jgi:hypothetical protein
MKNKKKKIIVVIAAMMRGHNGIGFKASLHMPLITSRSKNKITEKRVIVPLTHEIIRYKNFLSMHPPMVKD